MRGLTFLVLANTALALPGSLKASNDSPLEDRETPCVALGNCGGWPKPKPSQSVAPSKPPPTSSKAAPSSSATSAALDIGKYAVLGDSFASGVAWLVANYYDWPIDHDVCRRYRRAYGVQMQEDGRLGKNAKLEFLACSGSRTGDVRDKQVPKIPLDSSFATMSVGGNDVNFFPVMDACVLRSRAGYTDEDCETQVKLATDRIKNDVPGYHDIYKAVTQLKLTDPKFKLYVLGYPHFFNVDTDQCDHASFAYWKDPKGGPFLTKDIRKTINGLIEEMNKQLRAAVEATKSDKVQFVDLSPHFNGHRFCEKGIEEPYGGGIFTGIDDNAAWLYHFDWNPFHEMDYNKSQITNYPNAIWNCDKKFEDAHANDMGATLQCGLAKSKVTTQIFAGTLVENDGSDLSEEKAVKSLLTGDSTDPGQYGLFQRTFHPTHRGHTAIRDALFEVLGVK